LLSLLLARQQQPYEAVVLSLRNCASVQLCKGVRVNACV
jgi:hypothetical protein